MLRLDIFDLILRFRIQRLGVSSTRWGRRTGAGFVPVRVFFCGVPFLLDREFVLRVQDRVFVHVLEMDFERVGAGGQVGGELHFEQIALAVVDEGVGDEVAVDAGGARVGEDHLAIVAPGFAVAQAVVEFDEEGGGVLRDLQSPTLEG